MCICSGTNPKDGVPQGHSLQSRIGQECPTRVRPHQQIIKRIPVSLGHHGIDVSPDGTRIYVSGIVGNVISVIDAQSLEVISKIIVGTGSHGIRTSADGSILYVAVTQTNEIVEIDTKRLEIPD